MLGDISKVDKIFIKPGYTDMRKQLNGLVDMIQYEFKLDPFSNAVFLFCGRKADRIKAVHYEGDGFAFFIRGMKAEDSNGPEPGMKLGSLQNSNYAGC